MGLFDFLKKGAAKNVAPVNNGPYADPAANHIYELLFCDHAELYRANRTMPYTYPYDILFDDHATAVSLQKIAEDPTIESRIRLLAYRRIIPGDSNTLKKELLAVIVEVGLDLGLDTLASFRDGTARYINQSGKILVWETTTDPEANVITKDIFKEGELVVSKIGPWDKPRLRHPAFGKTRISFLVSDGLYFGEAPTDVLFKDELAAPALTAATRLMQYLTQKSLQDHKDRKNSD